MDKRKIKIFDTTLRDGEQAPGSSLYADEKIRIAMQLAKLGVDVIEPGFPASSPGDFKAVMEISQALRDTAVEICGFARAVKGDIDTAVKATQDAGKRRLHLFLSSSDIHLDFQLRKSREQVIEIARTQVAYAKQFVEQIEFSPMDATRTGESFLFQMVEAVIAEGATIINIPDTVGYALPEEFGRIFTRLQQEIRGGTQVEYSAHCHNDLGLAVANSLAALSAGATQVEVTVNGVGERAGNCSLEELIMAIETRKSTLGLETNINRSQIYETSRLVSRAMQFPIAFNKPIVGRNAFQHEAGIHQDGLLKNRSTYEIMDPKQMGIPRSMIILGKHSGRHALKHRVSEFGVKLDDVQLDQLFIQFKEKADEHKSVTDDQLVQLIGSAVDQRIETYSLVDLQVLTGSQRSRVASATIRNEFTGKEAVYSGTGDGPIEALVRCMEQSVPYEVRFEDLELHSMSAGEQAQGEAVVSISVDGTMYRGNAADQDIILAVAKAYMTACNQAVRAISSNRADESPTQFYPQTI